MAECKKPFKYPAHGGSHGRGTWMAKDRGPIPEPGGCLARKRCHTPPLQAEADNGAPLLRLYAAPCGRTVYTYIYIYITYCRLSVRYCLLIALDEHVFSLVDMGLGPRLKSQAATFRATNIRAICHQSGKYNSGIS